MTNPGNLPESPKQGFKITLMQGVIGAISLAGTTAIPLIVQRALTPPTSPPGSVQSLPTEITPAQMTPATISPQDPSATATSEDDHEGNRKRKDKKRD